MAHRTAGGKLIDMNQLMLQNETEIAVGNTMTNARGDRIGPGGQIIQTRDQIMKEYYQGQQGDEIDMPIISGDHQIKHQVEAIVDQINNEEPAAPVIVPEIAEAAVQTEALAKSQALAERLKAQRKAQSENKN